MQVTPIKDLNDANDATKTGNDGSTHDQNGNAPGKHRSAFDWVGRTSEK